MSYTPIRNDQFTRGVVQEKEAFKIDENAFEELFNCYTWRNRILRRRGNRKLGRLRRCLDSEDLGDAPASGDTYSANIIQVLSLEANASIFPDDLTITIGSLITVESDGAGGFTQTDGTASIDEDNSFINYATSDFTIVLSDGEFDSESVSIDFCYHPNLPVMGVRTRELVTINEEQMVVFDTKYAYQFSEATNLFEELAPGTEWSGTDSNFFFTTNYWQDASFNDLFWATNFSGTAGDPIRYFNGTTWTDFTPDLDGTNELHQCLLLIPFRGLLLALNTFEGESLTASIQFPQRVRASQIGSPLEADAWRDDIPGKGFFFDLPTNEHIKSFGFVRDSLVVFTERSSWLLSWTGDSIVPVIEQRENTDLGIESTFSVLNFDDRVIGIGDKFIVSSDSINSVAINNDIPDFAFTVHNGNDGRRRVHGVRDYNNRLALWTYPELDSDPKFPNRILVWNYMDNTWQFFRDNVTCFGFFQSTRDLVWREVNWTWAEWTQTWAEGSTQSEYPDISAGNQHGYVMLVGRQTMDDPSMPISEINIVSNQVQFQIIDHNLEEGEFISVSGIVGDYEDLNDKIFQVGIVNASNVSLFELTGNTFSPVTHEEGNYIGLGEASIVSNFRIVSKKFNLIDQGKKILLAYIDLLFESDSNSIFNLHLYQDYRQDFMRRSRFWSKEIRPEENFIDTPGQTKTFRKYYVGAMGNFMQYEITIEDQNMPAQNPGMYMQLDSVVLYVRPSGRLAN